MMMSNNLLTPEQAREIQEQLFKYIGNRPTATYLSIFLGKISGDGQAFVDNTRSAPRYDQGCDLRVQTNRSVKERASHCV